MDNFDTFIDSDIYKKAIELVKNKTNIEVAQDCTDIIKYRELNILTKTNITIDEIINIFENDFDKIINFTILKIKYYENEEDNGGDFPEGEGPGEDEKPVTIQKLKYIKTFMLRYIIEYYLIKNKPENLLQYIKDARIPKSKKYEKELNEIYNKIIE
jgi:hypothetical protein